jgi:hypothetical protein
MKVRVMLIFLWHSSELISMKTGVGIDLRLGPIVDVIGKGGHIRSISMPLWDKSAMGEWIRGSRLTVGRGYAQ